MAELSRQTLSEQIAARLLSHIEDAGLGPGDRLPAEGRLAEQYGVSKPVVREAMRTLQARGVTETSNGKGAVVRPVDATNLQFFFAWGSRLRPSGILELMEVRRGIEIQSATLAATRRTDAQAAEIAAIASEMAAHLDDPVHYTALDVELHLTVAAASGNEVLRLLVESLRGVLRESIHEGLRSRRSSVELATVQRLHEDIARAISSGDADAAALAMMRHFDDAVTALVRGATPTRTAPERTQVAG